MYVEGNVGGGYHLVGRTLSLGIPFTPPEVGAVVLVEAQPSPTVKGWTYFHTIARER